MEPKNLYMMISDIRYELHNGVCTMGMCSKCKQYPARGSGVCIKCREEELAELVGEELAYSFVNITKSTNGIVSAMEESSKRKRNEN